MYFSRKLIPLLLLLCSMWFWSCGDNSPEPQDLSASSQPQAVEQEATPRGVETQTASQRIAPDFSTQKSFPVLYQLLADQGQFSFVEILGMYALPAIHQEGINNEAQLISVLQTQKTTMLALQSTMASMPTDIVIPKLKEIDKELRQIGISANENGSVVLKIEDHFSDLIKKLGTDPFSYYKAFIQAQARFQAAAYPYRDMEPIKDMIVAGEKLLTAYPKSIHYKTIKTDFREALSSFVGVFTTLEGGYSSIRTQNPMIDQEKYIAEMETHKSFLEEQPNSRYQSIVASLIESPSETQLTPASLYVIFAKQVSSIEEARKIQFEGLNQAKEFRHILPYDPGTNKPGYLVAYRFLDDETKSLVVLDEIKKANPEAEVQYLNLSVNAGRLYQLGI